MSLNGKTAGPSEDDGGGSGGSKSRGDDNTVWIKNANRPAIATNFLPGDCYSTSVDVTFCPPDLHRFRSSGGREGVPIPVVSRQ